MLLALLVVTALLLVIAGVALKRRRDSHGIANQLIAWHRQFVGEARMDADDKDDDDSGDDGDDADDKDDDDSGDDGDDADDKPLGPKGERALQAEKTKRREAQQQLREWRALGLTPAQVKAMQAAAAKGGKDDDADLAAARQKAVDEAIAAGNTKANERILKAEIKTAAAGKLANPALAIKLLDLSKFEVDDDGNVDEDELSDAIDELLKKEPYLAAQGRKFKGGGDGGPQGDRSKKSKQLTAQEVKSMTPEQIVEAQSKGQLVDYLAS